MGQNVFIGNRVAIGDNVKIQNNVSVYDEVTLKDDAIEQPTAPNDRPSDVEARARALLERLDTIREAPLPSAEELPEWTEKQGERFEAFELRSESRAQHGRPD